MDQSAKVWNRLAARYAKQPIADQKTYDKKLALTRQYFSGNDSVLEFGCGTGSTALLHAPHVRKILAIDYSDKMIEIANGKLAESDVQNVTFQCSTLFDVTVEGDQENRFDVVLGLNVLHLIPGYEQSIARAYELLKPGGFFITGTVCITNLFFKAILPLLAAIRVVPPVQSIREAELRSAMTTTGFVMVDELKPRGSGVRSVFLVCQKPVAELDPAR